MPVQKEKSDSDIERTKKNRFADKEKASGDSNQEVEFTCSLFFNHTHTENGNNKSQLCIKLETVKLFAMMNYELTVEMEQREKEIDINILGIKTNHNYLKEVEPAIAKMFCEELSGRFTLNIIRQDGCTNSAVLDVDSTKNGINIVQELIPPEKENYKFCNFIVTSE
ncbi:MAG: hypothetical protein R6W90_01865 [Ignavibacteriaceae bacterium]